MKSILKYSTLILIIAFSISSCFKEDIQRDIPPPNEDETDTVRLGYSYHKQVYVDLNSLTQIAENDIIDWDLAFSCAADDYDIRLNSALTMYAGTNFDTVFENVISEEGIEMNFDASSGNQDSLAFGGWYDRGLSLRDAFRSNKYVYVVNRGMNADAVELGYKKVQFFLDENGYTIRHANLDGSEEKTLSITKNNSYNYIHFSFENGIVNSEPPQTDWSLKFSRYSTILHTNEGDPYDYNVVGVLLNPYKVLAIETDTLIHPFDSIVLADTAYYEFRSTSDVIGYNWKYYDFDSGDYITHQGKTYMIKDRDGFFYKLHFYDFYENGAKGNISYQVVRL